MSGVWLLAVIGPAMGSCAALLAERLPRGEPVVWARSECRACKAVLAPRDLVPLWSYARLGGRCRHCGARIPPRLWRAEWAGLALGAAAAGLAADPVQAVAAALWLWVLLALALADLRAFRLPDPLTLALAVFGAALAWPDWAGALTGAIAGAGAFWAIRAGYAAVAGREGMGLGDVKLMAGIGAGLGWMALPWVALVAALAALAGTWARQALRGRPLRRTTRVPFGAWLAGAAAAVWMAGRVM